MASKNRHELDQDRREQMRLLLAQQDEKAVAHRFGEQALQSDEYLQAQEDLEKRANAQRQRREEFYEADERQQAPQLGVEDSDQAVGIDEAGNDLDGPSADEIAREEARLLEHQEAQREEAERVQKEAERQAELDREVEQEHEQADREESRESAEQGRGDEQSVAQGGQDREPERELSTAQRLTAQHRASLAGQGLGDDVAEDQGRDAGDEVEHEPSTAERLNAQYRTQQEQERSRAAAMSL